MALISINRKYECYFPNYDSSKQTTLHSYFKNGTVVKWSNKCSFQLFELQNARNLIFRKICILPKLSNLLLLKSSSGSKKVMILVGELYVGPFWGHERTSHSNVLNIKREHFDIKPFRFLYHQEILIESSEMSQKKASSTQILTDIRTFF